MVGAYPIFIKYGSTGSQKSYLSVNKEAWGLTKFKKNKNKKASSKPHPTKLSILIFNCYQLISECLPITGKIKHL